LTTSDVQHHFLYGRAGDWNSRPHKNGAGYTPLLIKACDFWRLAKQTIFRKMKRIGILTAGGDTPAMNATIQGAVVRANQLRIEIFGLIKGFNSLFNPRVPHVHLNPLYQEIPEIDPTKGGTMIGSSRDYVDPEKKDELDTWHRRPDLRRRRRHT
jgi:hypothetical protein